MIRGEFFENIPLVRITLGWEGVTQCLPFILDTGFTDDLQITYDIAKSFNLQPGAITNTKTASGHIVGLPTSVLTASLEGNSEYVQANISNGSPLVGIGFLTKFGYKAVVDCKNRSVVLERA